MDLFKPEYESYQDVKHLLAWWASVLWIVALAVLYFFVIPNSARQFIKTLPLISSLAGKESLAVLVGLAVVISMISVHLLGLHEIYDRIFVRWRRRFDEETIIPALLSPVERLPRDAQELAIENRKDFLDSAFYFFVADRDMKIGKNLVVRFYERVARYWFLTYLEISAVIVFVVAIICLAIDSFDFRRDSRLVVVGCSALLVAIGARMTARFVRRSVRESTEDEIAAIHRDHSKTLGRQVRTAIARYRRGKRAAKKHPR